MPTARTPDLGRTWVSEATPAVTSVRERHILQTDTPALLYWVPGASVTPGHGPMGLATEICSLPLLQCGRVGS